MAQPNRINHEPIFLLASAPWRESSLWVEAFSRRYGRVALL
ncbi:DNA repair protein RecO, partial [Neisseria sp. P0001.S010]